MTINYTSLLGLAQPVTGTESGTWGDIVNDEITALLEEAIAGGASINVTAGDVTLTDTDGALNQARNAILLVTGTPGTSRNIIAPSASKVYLVKNGSDGAVVLKGSATSGITIPVGVEAVCFWNGSDFEIAGTIGAASSTDNAIARFDSTTGKVIQNSGVTIDDSNNVSGVVQLNATTVDATNVEVTNIKAKDGTAAITIADATGAVTIPSLAITGGTIIGVTQLEVAGTSSAGASVRLYEDTDNGTNYVALKSPDAVTSNLTLTLPTADGTSGQAIVTDGSGNLSFANAGISTGKAIAMAMIFGF